MMRPMLTLALLLTALCWAGCGAPPTIQAGAPEQHQLTLTMFTSTTDSRLTWFALEADGTLIFGGGRDALTRRGEPAGKLTSADKQRLLELIERYKLLQAPNHFLATGKKVTYQVELSVDRFSHAFTAADEEVPGLAILHQTLMDIQARTRYENLPVFQKLKK